MTPTEPRPNSLVFTIRQIAKTLSVNPSTAKRRARRERWTCYEERHPGYPIRLYPLAALPSDVQAALVRTLPHATATCIHRARRSGGRQL